MPSRPMNKGRSNDHDFVPPTQYKSSRTKQPRSSLLSQLELIPKAVMGYTMSYLQVRRNVRLVWLRVVRPRQVRKERFFKSFQKTPYESIRTEKNQEELDHREQDMAVRCVRFISVREELAGKNILSYQSLRSR